MPVLRRGFQTEGIGGGRDAPLVIWRITDGKAGHGSQSLGLARALARQSGCEVLDIPAPPAAASLAGLPLGSFAAGAALPDPDLIIGAGHGTHLAMLAAQRARGGKTVVLMKPSLPAAWFDLCLVPEHDNPPAAANILKTRGPLNTMAPSGTRDPGRGILLLGGPSRRHGWDEEDLLGQVRRITDKGTIHWCLADSARTPAGTRRRIEMIRRHNLEYLPVAETGRDRLERELATAARAWVSEDSMSMIYEALTAGAAVGVLSLPLRRRDRISEAVRRLAEQGWVTPYRGWLDRGDLQPPPSPLDESSRCARLVIEILHLRTRRSGDV